MKRTSINDNFTNIQNYILSSDKAVSLAELLQYVIDYDQYKEYYLNYHIFRDLLDEHNRSVELIQEEKEEDSLL